MGLGKIHYLTYRPLGYERVYLSLGKVADTTFHIQGDVIIRRCERGLSTVHVERIDPQRAYYAVTADRRQNNSFIFVTQ